METQLPERPHTSSHPNLKRPYIQALAGLDGFNYEDLFIHENNSRIVLAGRVDTINQANAIASAIKAANPEKAVLNCLTMKKVCATAGFEWETHLEYLLTTLVNKPVSISKEGRDGLLLTVLGWSQEEVSQTSSLLAALGVIERVRINVA